MDGKSKFREAEQCSQGHIQKNPSPNKETTGGGKVKFLSLVYSLVKYKIIILCNLLPDHNQDLLLHTKKQ